MLTAQQQVFVQALEEQNLAQVKLLLAEGLNPNFIDFEKGELKKNVFFITKLDVENKYDLRALHSRQKKDLNYVRVTGGKANYKLYKVKKGDTLARIAKKNHTTIKAICSKNKIKQNKVLRPGQKLKI
jgi:LysM repeat protein